MKRTVFLLVGLTLVLALAAPSLAHAGPSVAGAGAPDGPHYDLDLMGVVKSKAADIANDSGHRIFIKLWGTTNILLYAGDDYEVLDGNGTDGTASFQLPNPDPAKTGETQYSVWARVFDNPASMSGSTTCTSDASGEEWCPVYTLVLVRDIGNSWFMNASDQLLSIYVDLDGNGTPERYPLFNEALQGYFWNYDDNGLKLAQLRFYEGSTTAP